MIFSFGSFCDSWRSRFLVGRKGWHSHYRGYLSGWRSDFTTVDFFHQLNQMQRALLLLKAIFSRGGRAWMFGLSPVSVISDWGHAYHMWRPGQFSNSWSSVELKSYIDKKNNRSLLYGYKVYIFKKKNQRLLKQKKALIRRQRKRARFKNSKWFCSIRLSNRMIIRAAFKSYKSISKSVLWSADYRVRRKTLRKTLLKSNKIRYYKTKRISRLCDKFIKLNIRKKLHHSLTALLILKKHFFFRKVKLLPVFHNYKCNKISIVKDRFQTVLNQLGDEQIYSFACFIEWYIQKKKKKIIPITKNIYDEDFPDLNGFNRYVYVQNRKVKRKLKKRIGRLSRIYKLRKSRFHRKKRRKTYFKYFKTVLKRLRRTYLPLKKVFIKKKNKHKIYFYRKLNKILVKKNPIKIAKPLLKRYTSRVVHSILKKKRGYITVLNRSLKKRLKIAKRILFKMKSYKMPRRTNWGYASVERATWRSAGIAVSVKKRKKRRFKWFNRSFFVLQQNKNKIYTNFILAAKRKRYLRRIRKIEKNKIKTNRGITRYYSFPDVVLAGGLKGKHYSLVYEIENLSLPFVLLFSTKTPPYTSAYGVIWNQSPASCRVWASLVDQTWRYNHLEGLFTIFLKRLFVV